MWNVIRHHYHVRKLKLMRLMQEEMERKKEKSPSPKLGVIRLDYDYPPSKGDIDHPDSFPYDVIYKVVPGLTFEMCMSGILTEKVEERFKDSIKWLVDVKHVCAITGDCGFMMYLQPLAREVTDVPVFMSPLCLLPAVIAAYSQKCQIIVMTANRVSMEPMRDLIKKECGWDTHDERYHIVGCEDVPGFEAVANAEKVDTKKVEPGVVKKALEAREKYPESRAFLLECTELPPYADAIRFYTGLPVFDAITTCNFFVCGFQDDARFGLNDWQRKPSRTERVYSFGANLTEEEKKELVTKKQAPYINRFSRYNSSVTYPWYFGCALHLLRKAHLERAEHVDSKDIDEGYSSDVKIGNNTCA